MNSDDRTAVLSVVRTFFGGDEGPGREAMLSGPLLDWVMLRGEDSWSHRFEQVWTLAEAEIIELRESLAVVSVRAEYRASATRGLLEHRVRLDGPAVVEKAGGTWHIVDFTAAGRRRLEAIVIGPLAAQEQAGVTIRVLGVDKSATGTEVVLEIDNRGSTPARVDRAYVLLETMTWAKVVVATHEPVAAGASGRVILNTQAVLDLAQADLPLATRVRAGARRLPYQLRVPLTGQQEPLRSSPPRRLPLLRASWTRTLVSYAALTALAWWQYGWLALAVPVAFALWIYRGYRFSGSLVEPLHRLRGVIDVIVVAAAFLILWFSPAAELAVPVAVIAVSYAALLPLARRREDARVMAALSAGASWWFLLGMTTRPLAPCRLADGSPAHVADVFGRARLTGDLQIMHRYERRSLRRWDAIARPRASRAGARAVLQRRSDISGTRSCAYDRCYLYRAQGATKPGLFVGMTCAGRRWRVDVWFP